MQNCVRALLKVVDGIAQISALGVVKVDDVLAGANGQSILIDAVEVVAVDVDLFIRTLDLCSEGLIAYGLRFVQDLVRGLLKVVDGIAEVVALGVVNVDDVLASADGQGLLIDAVVVIAVDVDLFVGARDRFAYVLSPTRLRVQHFVRALFKVLDGVLRSVCRLFPCADQFNICLVDGNCISHGFAVIRPTVEVVSVGARVIGVTGLLHRCLLAGNIMLRILRRVYGCFVFKPIRHLIGLNGGVRRGNRSKSTVTLGESCATAIGIILAGGTPVRAVGVGLDIEGHDQLIAAGGGPVSYDVFLAGIVKISDRDGLFVEIDSDTRSDILAIVRPSITALISDLLDRRVGGRAGLVRRIAKSEVLRQRIRQDGVPIRLDAGLKNRAGDLLENSTQVATRNVHIVLGVGLLSSTVHTLCVGIIGGHIVHEVIDITAGISDHTNGENLCTVGVLCGMRLSDRTSRLTGFIAVLSRLTVCKENNNAGASFTQSVVRKHIVRHLHAVGRTGRTAGSQIIDGGSDIRTGRSYQCSPIIFWLQVDIAACQFAVNLHMVSLIII